MEIIKARNPHQGLPTLLNKIDHIGFVRDSRNGPVIMFPEPTTVVWEKPNERVVFWPEREANPFFHFCEAIWMLAGRRDVKFVAQFVKRMADFSDNGRTFNAAYGYRWRKNFQKDQLAIIIKGLQDNPDCRRQVLGIWDVRKDLGKVSRDLACNLGATFQISPDGKLNMVVHNRSNDLIMGMVGANAVHFSILQEYIAAGINVPVGKYWQVSSNLHVYMDDFDKFKGLAIHAPDPYRPIERCPYAQEVVRPTPLLEEGESLKEWDEFS